MTTKFSRVGRLVAVLLCTATWLSAQSNVSDDLARADKQYNLYLYNLARYSYEQVLKKDPKNAYVQARVGDCYFQLNRPAESLQWYEKAAKQSDAKPDVKLRYAKALMFTGDYTEAKKWFRQYGEGGDVVVSEHYATMCDYAAATAKKEGNYIAKNEPINGEAADYSPAFMGNRIVFISARSEKTVSKTTKATDETGSDMNQLYVTQRNPEGTYLQKPEPLRSQFNARNEGPVSYAANGARVAFCRNKFLNGVRQVDETTGFGLNLYTADVIDGNWTNIKQFPYNDSYPTGFPSLSFDGRTLLFASIRPGGFGGWDIYVSNWDGLEWSVPRNLGSPLNTQGNEISPYYDGTNLYFSSDWHKGLGGLDVFRAELGAEEIKNVYHLGPGVNSSYDDYGFIYNTELRLGYLTSNRTGGRGNEDIWQVNRKTIEASAAVNTSNQFNQTRPYGTAPVQYSNISSPSPAQYNTVSEDYSLLVTDAWGRTVPNAEVDLTGCYRTSVRTNADGQATFNLPQNANCSLTVRKTGLQEATIPIVSTGSHNLRISMAQDTRSQYAGTVYEGYSSAPMPDAVIYARSNTSNHTLQSKTDNVGRYQLMLNPAQEYIVTYAHDGYNDVQTTVKTDRALSGNTELPEVELRAGASDLLVWLAKNAPAAAPQTDAVAPVTYSTANTNTLNGYSIQLASGPSDFKEPPARYSDLTTYGNLYTREENGRYKLRLGVYATKVEADEVVKQISKSHNGAFSVPEPNMAPEMFVQPAMPVSAHTEVASTAPIQYGNTTKPLAMYKSAASTNPTASTAPVQYNATQPQPSNVALITAKKPVVEPPVKEWEPLNGYAVQLAASPEPLSEAKLAEYESLSKLGNLYSKQEDGMQKVRLGIFTTKIKAQEAMKQVVKDSKFKNAFVTEERGADDNLVMRDAAEAAARPTEYSIASKGVLNAPVTTAPLDNSPVRYAVQVGSFAADRSIPMNEFAKLDGLGNTYTKMENGLNKVRLGVWNNHANADAAKTEAINRGFQDAIVITEKASDQSLQNFLLDGAAATPAAQKQRSGAESARQVRPTEYSTPTQTTSSKTGEPKPYYIRIAALANPENFDPRPYQALGSIEKRPLENGMTLVLLGGYATLESATSAQNQLRDKGYLDPYVVKDDKGKLNRIK